MNTMRPRSGKEYQNIDRSVIVSTIQESSNQNCKSISPALSIASSNANYVNITPVPESSESSSSPGYQSSSSLQEDFTLIKVSVWSDKKIRDFHG
jgi:hypothetical protein